MRALILAVLFVARSALGQSMQCSPDDVNGLEIGYANMLAQKANLEMQLRKANARIAELEKQVPKKEEPKKEEDKK